MHVTFLFRRLEERGYFAKKNGFGSYQLSVTQKTTFFFVCFQIVNDRQEIVRKSSSVSKEIKPLPVYDR